MYRPAGFTVSFFMSLFEAIAGTSCMLDRCVYYWAEPKMILHHVYHLFPRHGMVTELGQLKDNRSFEQILSVAVKGVQSTQNVSVPLYQLILASMYVFSNIQERSLPFTLFSTIFIINDLISVGYALLAVVQNHCLIVLSTKLLMMRINLVRHNMLNCLAHADQWKLSTIQGIRRDVCDIFEVVQDEHLAKQYLLRNILIVFCPTASLTIYMLSIDMPFWLTMAFMTCTLPPQVLIALSLYFNGRLLTVSRSLLVPLYSMQVRMKFSRKTRYPCYSNISSMIKMIASDQQPLSFKLPDNTPLIPRTALDFIGSTISGTFLCLNNNILWNVF